MLKHTVRLYSAMNTKYGCTCCFSQVIGGAEQSGASYLTGLVAISSRKECDIKAISLFNTGSISCSTSIVRGDSRNMACKAAIFLAIITVARAGVIAPAPLPHAASVAAQYGPHPRYKYTYNIQGAVTGDSKTRDGDVVRGSYSRLEAGGTRRIVHYVADPVKGFNAVVHRKPARKPEAPVAKVPTPASALHHQVTL